MNKADYIRKVYEGIKSHKKPYYYKIKKINLTIFPNVFSPAYFTDSQWFAETLSTIVGKKKLLEIGTGTGIVALFCALNGAKVIATDINQKAVENAKVNFKRYNVKVRTLRSNIYDSLKDEKFDFIFWNHPFNKGTNPNEEVLLKAGFDYKYQSLEKYIKGAKKHLNPNGKLLLGTGEPADLKGIKKLALKYSYELILIKKTKRVLSKIGKVKDEYKIYHLKLIK